MEDLKLSNNAFVWVDSRFNPTEALDICFCSKESIKWELYNCIITEDEIKNFIDTLYNKGIAKLENNLLMVRMTDLPKKTQYKYLEYYKLQTIENGKY